MKKFLLTILVALFCVALLPACDSCSSCSGDEEPSESYTVEISQTSLTLDVYEMVQLTATVKDADGSVVDKDVEWSSSSSNVVTVEDGLLFAKSMGDATVTAQVADETASASVAVKVELNGYVPVLTLSESESLTLAAGTTFDLAPGVTFKGKDATDDDTTFIYAVADSSIASVTDGTITALKAGTTQITVTAGWRGLGGSTMAGSEDALGLRITLDLTVITVN